MPVAEEDERSQGEVLFGNAELGDSRRSARLAVVFDQIRKHPGGTLPDKIKSPADLKALYRLFACPQVTHEAILTSIRRHTLGRIAEEPGTVLVVHDATELEYTGIESLSDQLGFIGKGRRLRGYLCHNSLAVVAGTREVLGLTQQILHCREAVPEAETLPQRRARESRESRLWLKGTQNLPDDPRLVDVCDQGADTFEFLEHEYGSGRRFVIRSKRQRAVYLGHEPKGERRPLSEHLRGLRTQGTRILKVQSQKGHRPRCARKARCRISAGPVLVPRPHARWGNYKGKQPLRLWVVRVVEIKPPKGENPIEWALWTNASVETLEDSLQVIGWYETRWVVEELHKAMKTGCGIETLQFTSTKRLDPVIALLTAVAVTLLNLRTASRREDAQTRPATDVVSIDYVRVLSGWRFNLVRDDLTVWEFFYALARLGGHQNRKRDKPPGWLVLWRGWTTLQAMLDGAEAIGRKRCG
jgi:hypothetical protein